MKNLFVPYVALSLLAGACTSDHSVDSFPKECEVKLKISTPGWNGADETRATGTLLTPVTLMLVPEGGTVAVCREVIKDDEFCMEIPNGSWKIYAVCGLQPDVVPDDVNDPVVFDAYGIPDFAVGSAQISNNYGSLSASSLFISAKRQMAWMTVKITDIPDYFHEVSLNVKAMGDSYNIAEGWSASAEAQSAFTRFGVIKKKGNNYASVDLVTIPCTNKTEGTDFKIVATTTDNKTLTYTYTSTTPLISGKHLTLNLSISDLALVSETITTEDWENAEENGTLVEPTVE